MADRRAAVPAPRWARVAAWATIACVVPSAIWRVAVGFGVDLGWSDRQLDRQDIPGTGTVYVVALSVLSLAATALTLRLVHPDGDRLPRWVPVAAGRRVPVPVVVAIGLAGGALVTWIGVMSARNWDQVSGFADGPATGWAAVMAACYAPALLWAPLLLAVTIDYGRRHRSGGRDDDSSAPEPGELRSISGPRAAADSSPLRVTPAAVIARRASPVASAAGFGAARA